MSKNLAPRTSLRPQTPDDIKTRTANEAFGDLEYRWSLDPALKDDALARLGFSLPGEALYMGESRGWSTVPTGAWTGDSIPASDLMEDNLLEDYNARFPYKEGMFDQNTILYDDKWGSSPRALGHEYSHLGFDELVRLGVIPAVSTDTEEGIIEVGDVPFKDVPVNLPSRLRSLGSDTASVAETIQQYTDDMDPSQRELVEYYQAEAQDQALKLLQQRGEPPRTQPRFEDKSPAKSGIMSVLRGLFGGGN